MKLYRVPVEHTIKVSTFHVVAARNTYEATMKVGGSLVDSDLNPLALCETHLRDAASEAGDQAEMQQGMRVVGVESDMSVSTPIVLGVASESTTRTDSDDSASE